MKALAVIPARGGSKRIPLKNIRPFCGRPIIEYSIDAALNSGCFDKVLVSTDDERIADVARQAGASVPFFRPREIANDFAGTAPVVEHAIEWCKSEAELPEYTCCIYATAPLISVSAMREGYTTITEGRFDFAVSVARYSYPIQRALRINESNQIAMIDPEKLLVRSQDLDESYHDAGQFYWGKTSAWQLQKPIFASKTAPIIMPNERVQDIDTEEDWRCAEFMFAQLQATSGGGSEH